MATAKETTMRRRLRSSAAREARVSTRSRARPWFNQRPPVHLALDGSSWPVGALKFTNKWSLYLACGHWAPEAGEAFYDARLTTCETCLYSLDVLQQAVLVEVKEKFGEARVTVSEQAYPYAPGHVNKWGWKHEYLGEFPTAKPCPHRYIRPVRRALTPPPDWRNFNDPVSAEKTNRMAEDVIVCVDCGADVPGRVNFRGRSADQTIVDDLGGWPRNFR